MKVLFEESISYICPVCKDKDRLHVYLIIGETTLYCSECSRAYPVFQNVPIFSQTISSSIASKSISFDSDTREKFYEEHYQGRSRNEEIKSPYLLKERNFVKNFSCENSIHGFCLEIGCGTGIFADLLNKYIGLDYSLSALLAHDFEGYNRVATSAESIPFPNESFQMIFSFNTLEHIPQPELAFAEIDRLLEPGGYVILKPAWHCTAYNTKLLPKKKYSELNFPDKVHKFFIPVLSNKFFKALSRIPLRLIRRLFYQFFVSEKATKLKYRRLQPYLDNDGFIPDCDATADIDSHEAILYFESRGYQVLSHRTLQSRLFAGHDLLVVQKA